jgi:hypothetical protein
MEKKWMLSTLSEDISQNFCKTEKNTPPKKVIYAYNASLIAPFIFGI